MTLLLLLWRPHFENHRRRVLSSSRKALQRGGTWVETWMMDGKEPVWRTSAVGVEGGNE